HCDQRHRRRAGHAVAPGRLGRSAAVDDARAIRQAHRRRYREMGQGYPLGQYQGGVIQRTRAKVRMDAVKRQLHLNLFIHGRGHHEASWRHPASSPLALTDIRYYQDLAQRAAAGLFDSVFLADPLALGHDASQAARTWLEPVTVLAAMAVATSRVGLIATCSTTYTEPFNLARQFASIDHISNGRAAWNIVTSWLASAAENYGTAGQVSHA